MLKKLLLGVLIISVGCGILAADDALIAKKTAVFVEGGSAFSLCPNPVEFTSAEPAASPSSRQDDSLWYGTLVYNNAIGLTSGGTFEFAIRLTPTELGPYAGWNISGIKFHKHTGNLNNVVKVYDDGTQTNPGSMLTQEAYTSSGTDEWVTVMLSSPVAISGTGDLWCSVEATHNAGEYPATCDVGPAVDYKGDWLYLSGAWSEAQGYGFDVNWCIIAYLESGGGGDPDIDCTPNPLVFNAKDYQGQLEFASRIYPEKIDERLQEKMGNSSADELLPVIVEFDKTIDTQFLYNLVKNLPKSSRRNITITTLQDFTDEYQHDVMEYLRSMEHAGKVDRLSQLWLTNSIGMKAKKAVIEEIAAYPHIALIWLDDKLNQPHGRKTESGYEETAIENGREIVWNVSTVNADDVWGLGYTGDGIVVGHIDTGCNYNHNDLNTHMWDGGSSYPNHGWDYIDGDNNPMDTNGHGTHTAGTVASDGTAGSNCGVAPDALMMILRAVPGGLTELQSSINFCITQGADVITMSAGWDSAGAGGSWIYLSNQLRGSLDNCMSAGIVFCTSAGNGDGYGGHYAAPYDIGVPANVPASWYGSSGHSSCMAVGSTNQGNSYSSFSSRGPTQWMFSPWYEYSYPPGLIKPDIAAPGGSPGIKSCAYYNNSGYISGYTGTSMACPHVAGAIALMLEKDGSLTPEEIDSIIETTALDLGSTGKDNYYGAGLLDCLAAVNAIGGVAPVSGSFFCHNVGTATLIVSDITWSETWVSDVSPTSFSVSPGDSEGVTVDIDTSGLSTGTYYDTLWIANNDPDEDPYPEVIILYHGTGVEEEPVVKTYPAGYEVRCFPNPARNAASLMFTLPRKGDISLEVYDATGRRIASIAEGTYESGAHQVVWDRKDANGVRVPQGIYFVRLNAKGVEAKGKLILVN